MALKPTALVNAGGHPDVTLLPLGTAGIEKGAKAHSFRLPQGPDGVLPQAIIFITSQPWTDFAPPAPLALEAAENAPTRKQVPATIKFIVAGKELPLWKLDPHPTAYVINLATLKSNPKFNDGLLALTIDLQTEAPGLNLNAVGAPDPLLAGDSLDGPLSDFAETAKDPDLKAYYSGLLLELGEKSAEALAVYKKLVASPNADVARLARRGVRMMSYPFRPRKLSGNFNEHRRWALYLQQCGLLGPARDEFDECRIIYSDVPDTYLQAAEASDRLGVTGATLYNLLTQAAVLCAAAEPSDWYALVVTLDSRGGIKLSTGQRAEIKNSFFLMQGIVWGSTRGAVRIIPTFLTVSEESEWAYHFRGNPPHQVFGPSDDIVAQRGWFDCVFSVAPSVAGDSESGADGPITVATVGGDEGPNGAAMSCLPHDAAWPDYLQAFYEQFAWAARVGEVGVTFPELDRARYCGKRPVGHKGGAFRSALADGFTESMFRRPKIADEPQPGSYLRMWSVEGPFPVKDSTTGGGLPPHHVLEPLPPSAGPPVRLVSNTDFIDLKRLFHDAGPARARAACWVFSPEDQEVRMWLGQNDGMAAWLNGRCIHEGRYYSSGNFEDRNLVDTVASYARLKKGWNELRVVVEAWPAPRDKGWGFSVRFCDWENRPIPGLAYVHEPPASDLVAPYAPPKPGAYFSWNAVKGDYLDALPQLSAADLAAYTGIKGLNVSSEIEGMNGFVALSAPDASGRSSYRSLSSSWQPGRDSDLALNNVLDWARESCAALRFTKEGRDHDLLFIKPDSIENFLTLLIEPPDAKALFKGLSPLDRILGYVLVPAGQSRAPVIVADTLLADGKHWPADEDDLMDPLAPIYIPNRGITPRVTSQQAANP